jgi:hypothetical protein
MESLYISVMEPNICKQTEFVYRTLLFWFALLVFVCLSPLRRSLWRHYRPVFSFSAFVATVELTVPPRSLCSGLLINRCVFSFSTKFDRVPLIIFVFFAFFNLSCQPLSLLTYRQPLQRRQLMNAVRKRSCLLVALFFVIAFFLIYWNWFYLNAWFFKLFSSNV